MAWTAHAKIMYWVKKAGPLEVSGFGKITRHENQLHVRDAFLLEQENTSSSTDLKAEAISRELFLRKDEAGDFNFWWHSHNTMAAYFSKTDYDTIHELGGNGWLLATVFNVRNEQKTALYLKEPTEILIEDLSLNIQQPVLPESFTRPLDIAYDEKITELKHKNWEKWQKKKSYKWLKAASEDGDKTKRYKYKTHGKDRGWWVFDELLKIWVVDHDA